MCLLKNSCKYDNFEKGFAQTASLAAGDSISQGQLETKAIAATQLVRASSQRKASTSNAFSSTFFAAVISAASLRTKPQHFAKVAEAAA